MKGRSETMTLKVKDQIRRVRNSGVTNMFDIDGVMQAANNARFYNLVAYLADIENRREYIRYILTGNASLEGTSAPYTVKDISPETVKANEERINNLFSDLVPTRGKADTVAGEIIRAISRIGFRFYNDGDQIGVGYGKETCNPSARYLGHKASDEAAALIQYLWGQRDERLYTKGLAALEAEVLAFLDSHTELKSTPNTEDMFDYRDETEDVDDDWGDDNWNEDDIW
ncbi:protein of unknown function [Enterocloster clostridioformis]|nr:protein of unknown function [Enterocloster clostridioformis]